MSNRSEPDLTSEHNVDRTVTDLTINSEDGNSVSPVPTYSTSNQTETNDSRYPRRQRRARTRRRHTGARNTRFRHERALLHFGAAHILLGLICILLQMVQFKNHSILSETQPGLWSGTVFVITGAVFLALAKTKGVYSVIAMLCFSVVSLFLALTLSSLSWLGAEMAARCEFYWNYYCLDSSGVTTENSTSAISTIIYKEVLNYTTLPTSAVTPSTTEITTDETSIDSGSDLNCEEISHGYCGYDISLGKTIHTLLMFAGIFGATTSFVLSTLACSRPNSDEEAFRARHPSIYAIHGDHTPSGVRPITPWEFPPPSKEPLQLFSESADPEDPPPPYEEQDRSDLQTYL